MVFSLSVTAVLPGFFFAICGRKFPPLFKGISSAAITKCHNGLPEVPQP